MIGTSLGHYRIVEKIGEGGMGVVYRARDESLDRDVAIKVLQGAMAGDPSRLERFNREAKTISQLSHPHICTLHDVGQEGDVRFLVMEYLEGESLADRLQKGKIPFDEALQFSIEIADALGAAHRRGVVHRDLKPGNVMLTRDGAMLLDFGLAKLQTPSAVAAGSVLTTEDKPLTAEGTLLGTFQYMAPEQIEGKEADARADIFAFGAVLYEMLTGRRAFSGDSSASLIGAIMHEHPQPVSDLLPMTPPGLDRVVQTCLAKKRDGRWQAAHDLMLELKWIAKGGSAAGLPPAVAARRKARFWLGWVVSALASGAAVLFAVGYVSRAPRPTPPTSFHVQVPTDPVFVGSPRISPDGRIVAFLATGADGQTQIWLRRLESLDARPLPGTESSRSWETRPIWSPDSEQIAFFADGKLKKIAVDGGLPVTICEASGINGTWASSGEILYDGYMGDPIHRVSASGGIPETVVTVDTGEEQNWVLQPEFLPDGRRFLYLARNLRGKTKLILATLGSDETAELVDVDSKVQYAEPGYLLYVRSTTLVAQPFDARSGEITGEPQPIGDQMTFTDFGAADFSASHDGTLVYRAGVAGVRQLTWFDRSGRALGTVGEPAAYRDIMISPDGDKVAASILDYQSGNFDLWVLELKRAVASRLTFDPGTDVFPVWSPDGSRIVFSSDRRGPFGLYVKDASGSGEAEELLFDERGLYGSAWFGEGKFLAYCRPDAETGPDIWTLPMDPPGDPFPLVNSDFEELRPRFSPDGRWFAYHSAESGRFEVYVQPFPDARSRWQISTAGGSNSLWSADGNEIFYADGAGRLVSVQVQTGDTFTSGPPVVLFDAGISPTNPYREYAASPDGQRILLITPMEGESRHLIVVQNWPILLEK
jgi:serine/threonine protein kinase/Tol biopolymer transport system component